MKQSKVVNLVMASLILLTANGCSFFAPKTENVAVNTVPAGAEVYVNNDFKGTTPCNVPMSCKGGEIMVRKAGYDTQLYRVGRHLGTCGVMDIVGTVMFLVPAIGLFSAGAYTLDEHNVNVSLTKQAGN
ncbi:MAG: PEGA domain-containing protein [Lentisphaeria bacterium]|nr:PEGA domain-containing protein [Lentisphaeria bacterium]